MLAGLILVIYGKTVSEADMSASTDTVGFISDGSDAESQSCSESVSDSSSQEETQDTTDNTEFASVSSPVPIQIEAPLRPATVLKQEPEYTSDWKAEVADMREEASAILNGVRRTDLSYIQLQDLDRLALKQTCEELDITVTFFDSSGTVRFDIKPYGITARQYSTGAWADDVIYEEPLYTGELVEWPQGGLCAGLPECGSGRIIETEQTDLMDRIVLENSTGDDFQSYIETLIDQGYCLETYFDEGTVVSGHYTFCGVNEKGISVMVTYVEDTGMLSIRVLTKSR